MGVTAPDPAEQTTPVQDPAPVAAPVAPPNPGPWDSDLAQFTDPTVRAQVDTLLRTRIQPRMTQLEQANADARDAERLLNDLRTNPDETMTALATELNWTPEQVAASLEATASPASPSNELDPRVARAIEVIEQQENERQYMEQFNAIKAANPTIVDDVYHRMVVAAEGNFDQATLLYNQTVAELTPQQAADAGVEQVDPPAVLGGDGLTVPPTQKAYKNLGEAVDDFLNDQRATADPPPVA